MTKQFLNLHRLNDALSFEGDGPKFGPVGLLGLDAEGIAKALNAAYGPADAAQTARWAQGLERVAKAWAEGEHPKALMLAVHLGLPDIPAENLEKLAKFNPYHDELGRFTTADGAASPKDQSQSGSQSSRGYPNSHRETDLAAALTSGLGHASGASTPPTPGTQVADSGAIMSDAASGADATLKKPWERQSNPAFRQYLAHKESTADKPNDGYDAPSPKSSTALGRYQLLKGTLIDAGWKNADGTWTATAQKWGVKTDQDFLDNPEAQEAALTDVLDRYDKQLMANGALAYVDKIVPDQNGNPLRITYNGLIAAAHKQGAATVIDYLDAKRPQHPQLLFGFNQVRDIYPVHNIEGRLRDWAQYP